MTEDALVRRALRRLLGESGFDVVHAADPETSWWLATRAPPPVVIVADPRLGGRQLEDHAERLRSRGLDVAMVVFAHQLADGWTRLGDDDPATMAAREQAGATLVRTVRQLAAVAELPRRRHRRPVLRFR